MRKKTFLLFLSLIIIIIIIVMLMVGKKSKVGNIDVSEVQFDYDINICNDYFELAECIIDKDPDVTYTKQMRIDLKNEVREMQEGWRSLSQEDLLKKCSDELSKFDNDELKMKLKSFNCIE